MKPKRSGSVTSAETPNNAAEGQSGQCTKTLKKSLERKQDVLREKNSNILLEKEKS